MSQTKAHEILLQVWEEGKKKLSDKVDADDLSAFQSRSSEQLKRLVPILQKKADINDQVSMSLLWIARDYLPSVLTGSGQISDEMEKKIDAHFSDIARLSG